MKTNKMTIDKILLAFLKSRINTKVYEYEIENYLPTFGQHFFGKLHTAGSYSRRWRALRNSTDSFDFEYKEIPDSKNLGWIIYEIDRLF